MKFLPCLILFALAACPTLTAADAPNPAPVDPAARMAADRKLVSEMKFEKGVVIISNGLAKINLPEGYSYLSATDSETLLNKIWGNPPGEPPLGMIVPANFDPFGDHTWAVTIRYNDDGYVKDDDAATIDYDKMLTDMKSGMADANKERVAQGYQPLDLIGWATPPRYDAATHKLYWAKELKFGDNPEHTLNYNIRMLGRNGVLVLNVIAGMPDLKLVEDASPKILAMVDFQGGHRYADYNASTDKVAAYGVAALIAGGLAAKAGLFKGLWIALLAAKKIIILGIAAVGAFFKKMYNRLTGKADKQP